MKKILSALLALLTVGAMLISCSNNGGTSDGTTANDANNDASVETESKDPNADNLPSDLNLNGTEYKFYLGDDGRRNVICGPEEDTGDIVDTAVLERTRTVEDRLNAKITTAAFQESSENITNITNLILTGDTTYDMFMYQQWRMAKLVADDMFVNINTLDYVDFEKPYWNESYMNDMTLNPSKRVFLMGDYFADSMLQMRVIFYNKTMYGDRYGDPDGLYTRVLDNDWIIDDMTQIITEAYEDLNNDGKTDKDDRLGQVCWALAASVDSFVYGTDIEFTRRNSDGTIDITMMNEDSVILNEKLNALFNQSGNLVVSSNEHLQIFKNGNTQFLGFGRFTDATSLRDMESDFGFLPHPKFDEEQDEYKSLLHDAVINGVIPITAPHTDTIGAVLEALNYESSKTVKPTWYETALKIKYTRDDISSQMIDLIHGSATTNFLYSYNYALNNLGTIYRGLIDSNSNDFASKYASLEPAALESLETLTDYFNS